MPVDRTTFNNRCLGCKAATYQCGPCQKADDVLFKAAKAAFNASKGRPAAGGAGGDATLVKSYLDNLSATTLLPQAPSSPLPLPPSQRVVSSPPAAGGGGVNRMNLLRPPIQPPLADNTRVFVCTKTTTTHTCSGKIRACQLLKQHPWRTYSVDKDVGGTLFDVPFCFVYEYLVFLGANCTTLPFLEISVGDACMGWRGFSSYST